MAGGTFKSSSPDQEDSNRSETAFRAGKTSDRPTQFPRRNRFHLHDFKFNTANIWQPIFPIGARTRQYGPYCRCKSQYGTQPERYANVSDHSVRRRAAELALSAEHRILADHDPTAPVDRQEGEFGVRQSDLLLHLAVPEQPRQQPQRAARSDRP